MCKIDIEDFLGEFYKELITEYKSESKVYHKQLYDRYVPMVIQETLENKSCNDFYSDYCRPDDWKIDIQLFVNVFEKIRIYFYCITELKPYVKQLVNDKNFRELVKVAFYISETIQPRN